jgi:hypothetical protein
MSIRGFYRIAALLAASASGLLYAQGQCGNYTLNGVYLISYEGTLIYTPPGATQPVPAPFVVLGVFSRDYQGNWSGASTTSLGGQILEAELVQLTTQVNADCTGTATWTAKVKGTNTVIPGQGMDKIFVTPDGSEVKGISIQSPQGKPISLGAWKRVMVIPPVAW